MNIQVIIMAFNCAECGYKNSEIRGGGALPTLGNDEIGILLLHSATAIP